MYPATGISKTTYPDSLLRCTGLQCTLLAAKCKPTKGIEVSFGVGWGELVNQQFAPAVKTFVSLATLIDNALVCQCLANYAANEIAVPIITYNSKCVLLAKELTHSRLFLLSH